MAFLSIRNGSAKAPYPIQSSSIAFGSYKRFIQRMKLPHVGCHEKKGAVHFPSFKLKPINGSTADNTEDLEIITAAGHYTFDKNGHPEDVTHGSWKTILIFFQGF